jgi:hypothetical protein
MVKSRGYVKILFIQLQTNGERWIHPAREVDSKFYVSFRYYPKRAFADYSPLQPNNSTITLFMVSSEKQSPVGKTSDSGKKRRFKTLNEKHIIGFLFLICLLATTWIFGVLFFWISTERFVPMIG